MSVPLLGAGRTARLKSRAETVTRLADILGDERLLYLPAVGEGATPTESSSHGATITFGNHADGDLTVLGNGAVRAFNGTNRYGTLADHNRYSFGDGASDVPFSVFALVNVVNSASTKCLLGKWALGAFEWALDITANSPFIVFSVRDVSASNAQCFRASDAAISAGVWTFLAAVYDGRSANAADGMTLYVNGVAVASTATNNSGGTYVAMENGAEEVGLGVRNTHTAAFMNGSLGFVGLAGGVVSGAAIAVIAQVMRDLYGVAL